MHAWTVVAISPWIADAFEGYLSAKARDVVDNASKTIGRTAEHLTGGGESGALATGMGKIAQGEGPVKGAAAAAGQGIKDKAKNLVGGMGAFSVAASERPRTRRVCAGSTTPSSHNRAVA